MSHKTVKHLRTINDVFVYWCRVYACISSERQIALYQDAFRSNRPFWRFYLLDVCWSIPLSYLNSRTSLVDSVLLFCDLTKKNDTNEMHSFVFLKTALLWQMKGHIPQCEWCYYLYINRLFEYIKCIAIVICKLGKITINIFS